jgi:hypothetical protein
VIHFRGLETTTLQGPYQLAVLAQKHGVFVDDAVESLEIVGSRIRFRREQLEIAITKAATHVGVALQTYAEYETGERLIPANQLADIAELFGVPVFYFFEDLQVGDDSSIVAKPKLGICRRDGDWSDCNSN